MNDNPSRGQQFTSPAFSGTWRLVAGEHYSSGKWHGGWDVGCPIGTPALAPVDCVVGDLHDGVANQPVGVPGGPGSPSNWVLLHWTHPRLGPVTLWYQHLNRGISVRRGQRVKAGTVIAHSGNTGNTYGPHLHLQAMKGHRTGTGRWVVYNDRSQNLYPPSRTWAGMTTTPPPAEDDDMTPEQAKMLKDVHDVLFHGGPGTARYWTVYQRLARVEEVLWMGNKTGTPRESTVYQMLRRVADKMGV